MFNSNLKKEWLSRLEDKQEKYLEEMNKTQEMVVELFETRKDAVNVIKQVEICVNSITNTPKEFKTTLQQVHIRLQEFNDIINLKEESEITAKISGGIAGTGALVGSGVALLGPAAAMAIATTFGTASTGTSIALLSGAASTNAAVAWLGGGALAASGGGMAAGNAFLALAGPIGWAIGGAALIGGVLFASSKNKKIAEEAEDNVYKVEEQIDYIIKTRVELATTQKLTYEHYLSLGQELLRINESITQVRSNVGLLDRIKMLLSSKFRKSLVENDAAASKSYKNFSIDLKNDLGSLVNNTSSLAALIEKKLG